MYDAETWRFQAEALLAQLEKAHDALEAEDEGEREAVWEEIAGDEHGSLMSQTRNMLARSEPKAHDAV